MKFVISLCFCLCLNSYASPIRIFYEENTRWAQKIKETLISDYLIPEELIELKSTMNCEGLNHGGKLDLCLKNNGDLFVVSVDRVFVNESLSVFRTP